MQTAPKPEFWHGERVKTSNENASATPSDAICFDVFKCEPLQNLYSGRVGVAKHRTESQIRDCLGTDGPVRKCPLGGRGSCTDVAPQIGQNAQGFKKKGTL